MILSTQDISTEDVIKLTENKVHEQDGSVVKTPTLPAPTSRSADGAASVQPMGVTPNCVPRDSLLELYPSREVLSES